jgi:hypothetical protein
MKPVGISAFQGIVDAIEREAYGLILTHPEFAAPLDGLKQKIIFRFSGSLAGDGLASMQFLKTRQHIRDITNRHEHFGLLAKNFLGHLKNGQPAPAFLDDNWLVDVGVVGIEYAPQHAQFSLAVAFTVGIGFVFGEPVPLIANSEHHIQASAGRGGMDGGILGQDVAQESAAGTGQTAKKNVLPVAHK